MKLKSYTIKSPDGFYSVYFDLNKFNAFLGLGSIGQLELGLKCFTNHMVPLARLEDYLKEATSYPLKFEDQKTEQIAHIIKNSQTAVFHFTGQNTDLLIAQQRHIELYGVEYFVKRIRMSEPYKEEVGWGETHVNARQDYVEVQVQADNNKTTSKLEKAIRRSCIQIKDDDAAKKFVALSAASSEEKALSESDFKRIVYGYS